MGDTRNNERQSFGAAPDTASTNSPASDALVAGSDDVCMVVFCSDSPSFCCCVDSSGEGFGYTVGASICVCSEIGDEVLFTMAPISEEEEMVSFEETGERGLFNRIGCVEGCTIASGKLTVSEGVGC